MRTATFFPSLLFAVLPLAAQEVVPVEEEPRHHLVFANPYVRVIDARLPPGYVSLYHIHAEDNVPVAIRGGSLEIQSLGEEPRRVEAQSGSVTFAAGGYAHRVSNLGEDTIRYIDAEILSTPRRRDEAGVGDPTPGHTLELDNERVRVYRLELPAGAHRPAHRHAGAVLEVVLEGDEVRRGEAATPVRPGDFRWLEEGSFAGVAATGASAFEVIEIEWK